jgi:hypothetical protein
VAQARRRSAKRRNVLTAGVSLIGHAAAVFVLLSAHRDTPRLAEPQPMAVQLVDARPVAEVVTPPAPAPPAPVEPPPPPRNIIKPKPAPRSDVRPIPADEGPTGEGVELSDAEVASAATVGSGPSGRPCDMARRLQAALRKDAQVQAAIADARGSRGASKALFVWNGDWIRSNGQDGAGLAALREAIMWEVGFAPEACRSEPVHGLVLLSLNDAPGGARVVVGSGAWRWSDLLRPRGAGAGETLRR